MHSNNETIDAINDTLLLLSKSNLSINLIIIYFKFNIISLHNINPFDVI
ncbi:hypothetical protein PPBDW_II1056 [Photobacterium kishitanii]|nr:hypothetical protein PPBDW_II1056 [Photobacterium kishitanii]